MENPGRGDPHLSKEDRAVLEAGKAVLALVRKVWAIVTAPDAAAPEEEAALARLRQEQQE